MKNIIGTIIKLGDFLSKNSSTITVKIGDKSTQTIDLAEGRKYIVPNYQRELRWEIQNLYELIGDISKGSKFIGNIILSKKVESQNSTVNYEIIDGQQRMTSLLMIIAYVNSRYGEAIGKFETCKLEVKTFVALTKLFDNAFCELTDEDKATDHLKQEKKYKALWESMGSCQYLETKDKCKDLIKNLKNCEINILLNEDADYSSDYFLDVNTKGVRLDNEDTFKVFLFNEVHEEELFNLWSKIKIEAYKFNNKNAEYTFMKIISHSLKYLTLKEQKLSYMEYGDDFLLTKDIEIDGTKYLHGEHVLKAIGNKEKLNKNLNGLLSYMKNINTIVESESLNDDIKSIFTVNDSIIDNEELVIMHNFVRKILLDRDVVPKLILMKSLRDFWENNSRKKDEVNNIYSVYLFSTLFSNFQTKKTTDIAIAILSKNNWQNEIIEYCRKLLEKPNPEKLANIKYKVTDDIKIDFQYRAKSLATIYNYFKITNDKIGIDTAKISEIKEFISCSNLFSTEHFFVNDKGTVVYKDLNLQYKYNSEIKKYKNSLFNFIFIPKEINGNDYKYGARDIKSKIEYLKANINEIKCEYSKYIIYNNGIDLSKFPAIDADISKADFENKLELFYNGDYIGVFLNFIENIMLLIKNKLS